MKFIKLREHQKSSGGGNLYVKIGDGESLTVVPRGEIFGFRVNWDGGKAVEIPEANPANFNRFKMNVIVSDNGVYSARIWEFGIVIYNQLAAYSEEMDLTKTKIKVSRKGLSKATEWLLIPLGPVKSTEIVNIESVKLNILGSRAENDYQYDRTPYNNREADSLPPEDIPYFGDDPGITEEDLPF